MKKYALLLLWISCACMVSAQVANAVSVRDSRGEEGEYLLDATVDNPGVYSLLVRYPAAKGGPRVYFDTVSVSRRFIAIPADEAGALGGRSKVESVLGNAWGAVDTSVMYRLPYSEHKKDAVYSLAVEGGWASHVFSLAEGDTVFAARRGIVVCVREMENNINLRGIEILVQHIDGSWASYKGVARGSVMVAAGQTVWPDMPLALAGKSRKYGWSVVLAVKYPTLIERKGCGEFILENLNPSFAIASSEQLQGKGRRYIFVPRLSYEIITQEMTPGDRETMKKMIETYKK